MDIYVTILVCVNGGGEGGGVGLYGCLFAVCVYICLCVY